MIAQSEVKSLRGRHVEVRYLSRSGVIYCRRGDLKFSGLKHIGIVNLRTGFLYRIPVAATQSIKEVQQ